MFLLLMIPLPYIFYFKITFPLQLESSRLAGAVLGAMGMPVLRSGNILHLEHYTLEVVTACSGLRSMMTLGTIAIFLSDFIRTRRVGQFLLIMLAVPVAVFSNTIRLVTTAVISAVAGPESAEGFLHGLSGVVVFLTGLLVLLVCGRILEWLFPKSR
jgi:exosortase